MKFSVEIMLKISLLLAELGLSSPLSSSAKCVALIKTEGHEDGAQGAAEAVTALTSKGTVFLDKMHWEASNLC